MTIAIYGSKRQDATAINALKAFLLSLRQKGIRSVMHGKLYRFLCQTDRAAADLADTVCDTPDFCADLAVSLGGDGTFLRTTAWVGRREIPIVGVNTGHVGYLAALSIGQLPRLTDLIAADALAVERRILVEVSCPALPDDAWPYALNEAVVSKMDNASMIEAEVRIDGHLMAHYRADGLIAATPTGSTAYNLSVGGPIIQPTVNAFAISPVAAHSLSMRPMVVDADSVLSVVTGGRSDHARLALDGRCYTIPTGAPVTIRKAPFHTLILQPSSHSFAQTLREKLLV